MRWIVVATIAAVLVGCSRSEQSESYAALEAEAPAADAASAVSGVVLNTEIVRDPEAAPAAASPAMIAYEYGYTLSAPQSQIRDLIARHEARCRAAGPATCQIIQSNISERGDARLEGRLVMRAAPEWVAGFRGGLARDVETSDGRIIDTGVESEDLSRTIIDISARLRARTALRDRLQNLLDTRPGKLADLIEIERELARVQGEIDSAQSQLTHERTRVATSRLTLEYESRSALARDTVWSPLADAFGDFVELMVGVLAFLIRAIAVLLPLAVIGWLLALVFRKPLGRWRESRRQKKSQKLALKKANRALTRRRWPV